jgi:hypothetical protein
MTARILALVAENVLANPEPDPPAYAGGWEKRFGALLDWTGIDADGCPLSGAGQIESATTDVGTQWIDVGQCLPFDVGTWPLVVFAIPNYAGSIQADPSVEAFQPQSFEALFDRAYAGRRPRVFTDDFEIEGTCRWSAAAR